jgi:hypothetical protein
MGGHERRLDVGGLECASRFQSLQSCRRAAGEVVRTSGVDVDGPELSLLLSDLSALIATGQKQGWALVALDYAPESTGPAGEPEATLLAGFAAFERSLISQRIRQALAAKQAQGVRLGRPPTMSTYAIERITRERAAGHSLTQIANGLNTDQVPTAQAGRRWYPATIRHTLNRIP